MPTETVPTETLTDVTVVYRRQGAPRLATSCIHYIPLSQIRAVWRLAEAAEVPGAHVVTVITLGEGDRDVCVMEFEIPYGEIKRLVADIAGLAEQEDQEGPADDAGGEAP